MKKLRTFGSPIIVVSILSVNVCADTYNTFTARKYYSANRRYFVEVKPNKKASLFLNSRPSRRLWSRVLHELPAALVVSDDGSRVALVDFYYGNKGDASAKVVILLNETAREIASYKLEEVCNLNQVIQTISTAHWYSDVHLSEDNRFLVIDTMISKRDQRTCMHVRSIEESRECSEIVPFERLKFEVATGKLVERNKLAAQ